jgi:hypothetical protein
VTSPAGATTSYNNRHLLSLFGYPLLDPLPNAAAATSFVLDNGHLLDPYHLPPVTNVFPVPAKSTAIRVGGAISYIYTERNSGDLPATGTAATVAA